MGIHDLYDRVLIAEQTMQEDDDILSKISKEIGNLSNIFTDEQIRLIRYLLSIDRQYAKNDYEKANDEVEIVELENIRKVFE